jgi:hypothetical protein
MKNEKKDFFQMGWINRVRSVSVGTAYEYPGG